MKLLQIITLAALLCASVLHAEEPAAEKPAIPEIEALDDVISEAMHGPVETADANGTAALWPNLKKTSDALLAAKLPEAYADVAADFDTARARMNESVVEFGKTVETKDSAAILAAMLRIHEDMSRVEAAVNGMCYELVALHDVIAPIQHRALPDKNWAAIKTALPDLKARIDALKTAKLPTRHAGVSADFTKQADLLETAWSELEAACGKDDTKAIEVAFGNIHDHFHSATELFR
jgi:hypothetical protein